MECEPEKVKVSGMSVDGAAAGASAGAADAGVVDKVLRATTGEPGNWGSMPFPLALYMYRIVHVRILQ